jgi:hypothetical protein
MPLSNDTTTRLAAWSYRRQRLGRDATDPLDALRSVVAVYSSHPTAPLSLLARSWPLDADRFAALEQRREAVRIPAMRGSVFLLPASTAPEVLAASRAPLKKLAGRLTYGGFDLESYEAIKQRVLDAAREPISAGALQEAVPTDGQLMVAVRVMSYEGLVLRIGTSLRSDSFQYVATDAWLGEPLPERNPDEAPAWLAGAYLRAFGPARIEDFAWWSGVTKTRARRALAACETVDVGGGLLLPAHLHDAFKQVEPLDLETIDLLPKWDAYAMGYAPDGRGRLVDPEHLLLAYSSARTQYGATAGDGLPLLLRGGRAVASWSHRFYGNRMRVEVAPFTTDVRSARDLESLFDDAGALLGAKSVTVAPPTG